MRCWPCSACAVDAAGRDTVTAVRWITAGLLLWGCASPASLTDAGADSDVGASAVDATPPPVDAVADRELPARVDRPAMDAPREPPRDVSAEPDVQTAPADVVIDPGMCGPTVRACFCACGANAVCQQGCINRDEDCGFCVYLAATRCCPAQSEALDRCIDASGCTDDPCIRTRCAGEVGAFEGCFASQQMSDPACLRELRGCLGSDHPQIRCVVQR